MIKFLTTVITRGPGPFAHPTGVLLQRPVAAPRPVAWHSELPDPAWAELVCVPASGMASPSMFRLRPPGIGFVLHKEGRIHPMLTL
jgi:hypothetical protein